MSTLAEIEAAIQSLPTAQVEVLSSWLNQRQRPASIPLTESPRSVRDFIGCFATGDSQGADNQRIDADLAREASRGL